MLTAVDMALNVRASENDATDYLRNCDNPANHHRDTCHTFESCDHQTRLSVSENIASFSHESQPLEDLRAAAVAIVIAAHRGNPTILLTRRSGKLRAHSGQWALPGGRLDAGESAEDAALRELKEEINLRLPRSAIMGRLDDYITRSGYRITPVALWSGKEPDHLKPNPDEVASIHTVSFKELANPSARLIPGDRQVLSMRLSVD